MALKASDSFFKFVTMGAAAAQRALATLRAIGFDAHELERYSTSNKIWQTKIKRLRLPDVFCIRTGARFEVRAKSKLELKMSDSPTVQGRQWDAGLRDEDIILFIQCTWKDGSPHPADRAEAFSVQALRATIETSKLGPPKSAGEGAERDRSWPALVASESGVVVAVDETCLRTKLDSGRRQSYGRSRRANKLQVTLQPYINVGERFEGGVQFLAGAPAKSVELRPRGIWDPASDLAADKLSRFAAVKALGLLRAEEETERIYELATNDSEPRVRLEAAGALVRLRDDRGGALLVRNFQQPPSGDLRMESVLIAGEVGNEVAQAALHQMLASPVDDDEIVAAIVWSLGTKGCCDLGTVSAFLGHASDLVASHAAVALGEEIDEDLLESLVDMLEQDDRAAASAAWVLQHASSTVVPRIVALAGSDTDARHWALGILGMRRKEDVAPAVLEKPELREALEAWWKATGPNNWLSSDEASGLIRFVSRQTL